MTINIELPQELGELVMKAIEAAMNPVGSEASERPDTPSYFARQADALVDIARSYLQGGTNTSISNPDNYTVMVHVDAEALIGKEGNGGKSDLPVETVRRLACDSHLLTVVKDTNGNPLDVGRKQRVISGAIKRALYARDRHCRFPGCSHTNFLQGHHLVHWIDGGKTRLDDLVLLCSRHHQLHHEGGYSINKHPEYGLIFRNADGKVIPHSPTCSSKAQLDASRDARETLLETVVELEKISDVHAVYQPEGGNRYSTTSPFLHKLVSFLNQGQT